jgi:hypothetical protein
VPSLVYGHLNKGNGVGWISPAFERSRGEGYGCQPLSKLLAGDLDSFRMVPLCVAQRLSAAIPLLLCL